jgi:hypothetical protein
LQVLLIGPLAGRAKAKKIRLLAVRLRALSQVPEALRYLGEGHVKGKVVVILEQPLADRTCAHGTVR